MSVQCSLGLKPGLGALLTVGSSPTRHLAEPPEAPQVAGPTAAAGRVATARGTPGSGITLRGGRRKGEPLRMPLSGYRQRDEMQAAALFRVSD